MFFVASKHMWNLNARGAAYSALHPIFRKTITSRTDRFRFVFSLPKFDVMNFIIVVLKFGRLPGEFKHITNRRKQNQLRYP